MAIPRGHTPRPYTPHVPADTTHSTHSTPPVRPVHGDYDAYGPHAYGGRARRTIPMSYWPPLDDDIEVQIRGRCQHCHGRGIVAGYETRCPVGTCRRRYLQETIRDLPRYGFRGRRLMLPCRHEITEQELLWVRRRCDICEGDGYLYRYVRWGDFVSEMYGDETTDETIDETTDETTARLRALVRAQHPEEPTAPPPQLAPHPVSYPASHPATGGPTSYYTPYTPQTPQERVTPQIGPHLAPMAPQQPQPPDDMPSRF